VADFGWHVQFYPAGDDLLAHEHELLSLPVPVVLDHFAAVPAVDGTSQPAFQCLLRMLSTGRVWVKLSGPMRCTPSDMPYCDVTPLACALVAQAPERLLWGSDWPHVNMVGRHMPNDGDLFDLLGEWVPDAETRRRILVDHPRQIYGFN
jgi:predicted TIM-barrel fold metal-dependent hydrolase